MKHHQRTALLVNLGVTLVILELLALRLQAQSMPYYVCDLRGMPAITAPVEIRGTAQRTPDGLIMFDYTCPSAVRRVLTQSHDNLFFKFSCAANMNVEGHFVQRQTRKEKLCWAMDMAASV
jgi:hypothetical protein